MPPRLILITGVAGSGKTTLGRALAAKLGWHFADADDFHPPANVAKMRAGIPLDDADRAPWLATLCAQLTQRYARAEPAILACSALKKSYRQQLLSAAPAGALGLVYLHGERELLAARLAARAHAFMPAALLDSQLATLEEPEHDEVSASDPLLRLNIAEPLAVLVHQACQHFGLRSASDAP